MNETKEIRICELFAGVGGFRKGFEQANNGLRPTKQKLAEKTYCGNTHRGRTKEIKQRIPRYTTVFANEWDKHASAVYKARFGEENFHEGDIREVNAADIPDHDLLCGGFPCQPFSIAGKRKGMEETRGTLFHEIMWIAKTKRPQTILLENVKGLLSAQEGWAFYTILSSLAKLGYSVEWQVLDSQFYGVPQHRERVFIIGHLGKFSGRKIFPIRQGNEWIKGKSNKRQVSACIQNCYHKGVNKQKQLVEEGGLMQVGTIGKDTEATRIYNPNGIARTIKDGGGMGAKTGLYAIPCAWRTRSYMNQPGHFEFKKDNKANQLTTVQKDSMTLIGQRIRRLTPTECERLQGFQDGWTKTGLYDGKLLPISDTQRYKMMGNAVTVNVIQAIAQKIKEVTK